MEDWQHCCALSETVALGEELPSNGVLGEEHDPFETSRLGVWVRRSFYYNTKITASISLPIVGRRWRRRRRKVPQAATEDG